MGESAGAETEAAPLRGHCRSARGARPGAVGYSKRGARAEAGRLKETGQAVQGDLEGRSSRERLAPASYSRSSYRTEWLPRRRGWRVSRSRGEEQANDAPLDPTRLTAHAYHPG